MQLLVNDISPIDWNCDAFARLILPKQYKNILYSIVESKLGQSEGFDDIIQGKGKRILSGRLNKLGSYVLSRARCDNASKWRSRCRENTDG